MAPQDPGQLRVRSPSPLVSPPIGETFPDIESEGPQQLAPENTTQGRIERASIEDILGFTTQGDVPSPIRLGIGLLRNTEDRISFLQSQFPDAMVLPQGEDEFGSPRLVLWRFEPADEADVRNVGNRFGADAIDLDEQTGEMFALRPTLVNHPGDVTVGDFAQFVPEVVQIAAGVLAKTPQGAAAVEAVSELARAGLGAALPGVERRAGDVAGEVAGAALGGAAGQAAANVLVGAVQRNLSPRNILARAAGRRSRETTERVTPGSFETVTDAQGRPIPSSEQPPGRIRRAASAVGRAAGRRAQDLPATLQAQSRAGALPELGPEDLPGEGIEVLEQALGTRAAQRIAEADQFAKRGVPVRDPETGSFTDPSTGRALRGGVTLTPGEATRVPFAQRMERTLREADPEFEQTRQLQVGQLVDNFAFGFRAPGQVVPEAAGRGVRDSYLSANQELWDNVVDRAAASLETAHRGLRAQRVFGFDNLLREVNRLLREEFPVGTTAGARQMRGILKKIRKEVGQKVTVARRGKGPLRVFGTAPRDRLPSRRARVGEQIVTQEPVRVTSRAMQRQLTSMGSKFRNEAVGNTNAAFAKDVQAKLFGALQKDFDEGVALVRGRAQRVAADTFVGENADTLQRINRGEIEVPASLQRESLQDPADVLLLARAQYAGGMEKIRNLRRSVLGDIVGIVRQRTGRGAGRVGAAREVPPEGIVDKVGRLAPSQLRSLFTTLDAVDPIVSTQMKSVLLDRIFEGALGDATRAGLREIDLPAFRKAMRGQGARLKVLVGAQRASDLQEVNNIVGNITRKHLRSADDPQLGFIAGGSRLLQFALQARFAQAVGQVGLLVSRLDVANLFLNRSLRQGLLRASKFPVKSAKSVRAFGRLYQQLRAFKAENEAPEEGQGQ